MYRTYGSADLEHSSQLVANLDAELSELKRLPPLSSRDQRTAGVDAKALHLGREDAERHADLVRGGRHRVVAGNKEEPFGALRGSLPHKAPTK